MNKKTVLLATLILSCFCTYSQNVGSTHEYIKALTPEWKGERFADGIPKVSVAIL